ncbi:hypothetical protein BTH41_01364 [Bacillus mycoides]|nr:hypothetical protein BTH41_01364 [Bacillus mycoides]
MLLLRNNEKASKMLAFLLFHLYMEMKRNIRAFLYRFQLQT